MPAKNETKFARSCDRELKERFRDVYSVNVQMVALRGIPDRLLCIKGKFIGIEFKTTEGKASPLQLYNLSKIKKAGGIGILASPDTWADDINRLSEELRDHPGNRNRT